MEKARLEFDGLVEWNHPDRRAWDDAQVSVGHVLSVSLKPFNYFKLEASDFALQDAMSGIVVSSSWHPGHFYSGFNTGIGSFITFSAQFRQNYSNVKIVQVFSIK